MQQNVKYDSETGKVYEELGSSGSGGCNQPSTSESNALLVNSASAAAAAMINGGSSYQNGASSFQVRGIFNKRAMAL